MNRRVLLATVLAVLVVGACSAPATGPSPAPSLADPSSEGMRLVTRFFDLLKNRDVEGLGAFLSPAFQIQRADGTGADKTSYVGTEPAQISTYQITDLRATQATGTLVTRYLADVSGTVDGRPYAPGPAPRLSVFVWTGSDWQLLAHANFNPLTG